MSRALRVALVGCGYITQAEYVPALLVLQPDVEVAVAVDLDSKRAASVAALFHAEHAASLKEALAAVEVEAVILCTPTSTHVDLIEEAAVAGKAILVEKPLSYCLSDARRAVEAVTRSGVRCMVAYHRRFDDDCLKVKALIAEGAIGEVRAAVSLCRLALPSYYRQYAAVGSSVGAGAGQDLPADWLTENSIHHLNLLRFWLGEVVRIHSAVYRNRDHNLGMITLEFPHGILATHHQLRGMDCGEQITVYGTRGNLCVELWYPHRPYRFPRTTLFAVDPPRWEEIVIPRTSPYTNEVSCFLKYVRGEGEMWSGLEDAYRDLEALQMILGQATYVGAGSE